MKKAWDDIKSFVTVSIITGYIVLTFMGKMTPEYQELTKFIVIFYFGTQVEKIKQLKEELQKKEDEMGGLG
jgi:DMSO/TMAO reductase YedYZ heme-binding membrane subunit